MKPDDYTYVLIAVDADGRDVDEFISDDTAALSKQREAWQTKGYTTRLTIKRKVRA